MSQPNPGFEDDLQYLGEREPHKGLAGRFIAVHKLRTTARDLETIIGDDSYKHLKICGLRIGIVTDGRWRSLLLLKPTGSWGVRGQGGIGDAKYRRCTSVPPPHCDFP